MLHEMLMLVKRKCKQILRVSLKNLPYFKPIYAQLDALEVPPGHVYSPIPDLEDIKAREQAIFDDVPADIPGIELNEEHQLTLLGHFKKYYDEQPFSSDTTKGLRYHFDNLLYPYSDAIILYCMIRHHTPKLIIEVGASGYSSCLILDVNERFLNNTLRCICIDPNGGSVLSSLEENDERNFSFIKKRVQDVDLRLFGKLSHNDILFVDSTHISKIDSDVNYVLFNILPSLSPGVLIHFHDIFYPFEYPREWIYNKRAWNENYILRAFLQYNSAFKI